MSLFSPTTTIVRSGERLLEYVDGTCRRVLEPGKHRLAKDAVVQRVVVLDRLDVMAPQEVLTSDGVAVRVTTAVRWSVADPLRFVGAAADPFGLVYLAIQVALRDELVDVTAEDAVRRARRTLAETLVTASRTAGAEVGIAVRDVVVKDVILPHELRAAYVELVTARARGLAQLEAARAETAALRSLANGAKLLEDHPALARLRLVQALPHGSTVELSTVD